jgi:hypothetical protein
MQFNKCHISYSTSASSTIDAILILAIDSTVPQNTGLSLSSLYYTKSTKFTFLKEFNYISKWVSIYTTIYTSLKLMKVLMNKKDQFLPQQLWMDKKQKLKFTLYLRSHYSDGTATDC